MVYILTKEFASIPAGTEFKKISHYRGRGEDKNAVYKSPDGMATFAASFVETNTDFFLKKPECIEKDFYPQTKVSPNRVIISFVSIREMNEMEMGSIQSFIDNIINSTLS